MNRLRHEVSPYLLAHAENPVAWWPWGPEALAEARRTGKPILLSIGYSACHWCHVMAHESFENAETAGLMNALYINIKVDREERPDIDQIYMAALHALGEPGGWPLTMFLTAAAEPFWGGTYFPPKPSYGRPAFSDVLRGVAETLATDPGAIEQNRRLIRGRLAERSRPGDLEPSEALLIAATERLSSLMDPDSGGVRGAPKFPQAPLLQFLWRAADYAPTADLRALVLTALEALCLGGIYDHVGGGIARYSVDARWLVPHFEKMLYDNAQLVDLLASAGVKFRSPLFLRRLDETIAWMIRDLQLPGGAFASALDADTPDGEGHFYVWTVDDLSQALGPAAGPFGAAYGVTPAGNWEGRSILNLLGSEDRGNDDRFQLERETLRRYRESRRARPARDDKILADWNGLAIASLAKAGWLCARPDWLASAKRAYRFVTDSMFAGGRLRHSFCGGRLGTVSLAADLAAYAKAALALHTALQDPRYLDDAIRAIADLQNYHAEPSGAGYLTTAADAEVLLVRLPANADEATPSATALALEAMVRLFHLTGDGTYLTAVDRSLAAVAGDIGANLFAGTGLLTALDLRLYAQSLVLVVPAEADAGPMLAVIRSAWSDRFVLRVVSEGTLLPSAHPAFGKAPKDGRPTLFVCRDGACSLPIVEPAAAAATLSQPPLSRPG